MTRIGQQAVAIGASMGGVLAARVLADFYEQVTVLERDTFPTGASPPAASCCRAASTRRRPR